MMNSCFLDQQHFYPDQPSSLSHFPQDLLGLELTLFSSCLMNFCHLIRHLMTSNYLKSFSMNPQHLNSFCCFRYLKCLIAYYLSPSYYCLRFLKYLIVYRLKPCLMNFQYLSSFGYCCLMTSIGCLNYLKYLSSFGYYLMKPYLNLIFRLMSTLLTTAV